MIKKTLKTIWDVLTEIGKHRYKQATRYGWY